MSQRPNLNNPDCRDALAGEYVLGTLHGAARRRFERLLVHSPDLQWRVAEWERTLAPLAEEVEPVTPPRAVWKRVRAEVGSGSGRWWDSLAFWRPAGMVLAAALVAVVVYFGAFPRGGPADYVFVVQGDRGQVQWVVSASAAGSRLQIRPVEPPGVGPERLCRLWWYPDQGTPRALAVLPEGNEAVEVRLPPEVRERIWRDEMAVTVAPADRKPEAGPVGEEVYRGRWAPMT